MLDKYVVISDTKILCGQNATTGMWYCKELPARTIKEASELMGQMNIELNRNNKVLPVKEKKEKKAGVRLS